MFDPTTAQPLPERPGAMAVQPLRPKGQVTQGRPLPPRSGQAQPQAISQGASPVAAPVVAPPAAPPTPVQPAFAAPVRPDARPMRLALGAGALAAMGALTVGLVQPDFSSAPDEVAAASGADSAAGAGRANRPRVRRVTEYVFLRPGERAPRGATVISAADLPGQRPAGRNRKPDRAAATRPDRSPTGTNTQPPAQPEPPRPATRQSGS